MKRTTTDEERALFRAALHAPLRPRAAPKHPHRKRAARKAALKAAPAPEPDDPPHQPGKRRATREERALFEQAVAGHAPVGKTAPVRHKTPPPQTKPQPPKSPAGLDGNTARKLRRGEIAPDTRLDLHGMTEAAAHRALTAFVLAAHMRGDRLALVVTGKGSPDPKAQRGILKLMVPRWLEEAPLAKLVAEKRLAHVRHGGDGALYVYLRKAKT
ncbi:MAG TPA: Smr/MutS family protein [Rhizomicrobium sp.]|nr:Smr/MutS family protein [Rhizomicrobium sp.]